MTNPLPAIRECHRAETKEIITISRDRFLCLYAIKCAVTDNKLERLAAKIRELGAIEARDFVNGVSQA